jgi:hypothetical protein
MRRTGLLKGAPQQSCGALLLADGVVKIDDLKHDELLSWVRVQTIRIHDLGALLVSVFDGESGVGETQSRLDLLAQLIFDGFYCVPSGIKSGFGFIDSLELEQHENAWHQNREIVRVEFNGSLDISQCVCVAGGLEVCVCAKC